MLQHSKWGVYKPILLMNINAKKSQTVTYQMSQNIKIDTHTHTHWTSGFI